MPSSLFPRSGRALFALCFVMALSGCSTTGRSFDSSAIGLMVPGQTTLDQANALLGSESVDTYRQLNGAVTARWAHKASLLTDAVYFQQELWLAFGPDGRFERVVKKVNIAHSTLPAATVAAPATARVNAHPPSGPLASTPDNSLAAFPAAQIDQTAVTYPLNY